MMGFLEWVEFNRKRKEKKVTDVRSISQSSQENGDVNNQRQTDRFDQEIPTTVVHYFSEPK
jgi:hypothetical protein